MEDRFDLAVVGLGYVGLPLAMTAADVGLRVLGVDPDAAKVEALNAGRSYVADVPDEQVRRAREAGFVARTELAGSPGADAYSICVPTPLRDHAPDLDAVIAATSAVGDMLTQGDLVILESTSYPGTTEEVVMPILAERSGLAAGSGFGLAYSPERIDPANEEWTLKTTPKIVAGIDTASTDQALALYGKFCEAVVRVTGTREAELAKLLENTYRQINIALVNEMAVFSRELGIDLYEAIRAATTKPFGFQPFFPGPGVGGHCIPIDPNYLSYRVRQLGYPFRFVELAHEVNNRMPSYVVQRVVQVLNQHRRPVRDSKILLVGVAYKPDVGDARESPAVPIARLLLELGADLRYCDPHVPVFDVDGAPVPREDDPVVAAAEADLAVVLTPHRDFDLAAIAASAPAVFDTRGVLPGHLAERL